MPHESPSWRGLFFAVGDLLFLLFVATASTAAMHLLHELHWNLVVTLLLGMLTAMAAQTLLALTVAPILGSIESMVPSMLVAMSSPMIVCVFDLFGVSITWRGSLALGAGVGALVYFAVQCYAWVCRRRLSRFC
jgi:hypothetical protein